MMKWYYQMWSDGIYSLQKKKEKDPTMLPWQVGSFTLISFAQGFNLLTVCFGLMTAGINIGHLPEIDLFGVSIIDKALSTFIPLFLPFFAINYFLIFYKKRYKEIMKRFPPKNAKGLSMILYFFISLALFIAPLWMISIIK